MFEINAAPGVHEQVMDMMRSESRGLVLDSPSGSGAFSDMLYREGFKVCALDIGENVFTADKEIVSFKRGDLNGRLDYADNYFDHVVCIEGIEHIENPNALLREFSRVMKSGGKMIVTTPNINNIASRIKFLIFGSFKYFNSKISSGDKSLSAHINPIWFPELEMALERAGFIIDEIRVNNRIRLAEILFFPVTLIIYILNKIFNKAFNGVLLSPKLLFGEIIILKMRKIR